MSGTGTRAIRTRTIPSRRFFTPERAGRALVLVKRIVADLVRSHHRAHELEESLEAAEGADLAHRAAAAREALLRAAGRVHRCLEELGDLGAEMADARLGIVDFPARAGRREVRLCWRWGERGVAWWHEVDEAHAQRKLIGEM